MAYRKYLLIVFLMALSFLGLEANAQKYVNPPGEDTVAPKLVVVQPNPGGYNLENRVYELERAADSLNRYVDHLQRQNQRLERRVNRLERELGSGGGGGFSRVSCELRVRDRFGQTILEVFEDGSDEGQVRDVIQRTCESRIDRRLCDPRQIVCRGNGRF